MYLDIVVAAILFLTVIFGLKNGFFIEFFSIFGIVINFILAKKATPLIMERVGILNDNSNYIMVYIGTFWALYLVLGILMYLTTIIFRTQRKSPANRVLGAVLGFGKGLILTIALLFVFNFFSSRYTNLEKYSNGSKTNKVFLENITHIESYVPEEFKEKIKEMKDNELINRYFNKLI
ncbi:MAG: CvpA family protein [Cetobacterium sp.]|uniref:CvpA family protein n=1 Tax=unclassified Cetobacterium TaxID=2630983 RepID=UPI00163CAA04|nr:CvpA family protein [Cetobacterium sp. 2A]MBC2855894.1 CvpA family protein [Cetobacterium sp. 2A]